MSDNVVPIFDRAEVIARRTILAALEEMSVDELRAVAKLLTKLNDGSREHGRLDLKTDPRNFRRERNREGYDWIWYDIFDEIVREDAKENK